MNAPPTIGRLVHYTLSEDDATIINGERAAAPALPGLPAYAKVKRGNTAHAGATYPAMVVAVFQPAFGTEANLQVVLDGNDTYWACSRTEGPGPGHWKWPLRAGS